VRSTKLSICIATYNRKEEVYKCIKEALALNIEGLEVVVSDNCSTDGTEEKVLSIKDSRLKYYKNEKNIGFANIMKPVFLAEGEYALLIGDKDKAIEAGIKEAIRCLDEHKDVGIVYGDYKGNWRQRAFRPTGIFGCSEMIKKVYWHGGYSTGIIYRKSILKNIEKDIDEESLIWNIYPFRYCDVLLYPKCKVSVIGRPLVENVVEKANCDVKAWKGNGNSSSCAYWLSDSLMAQIVEWTKIFTTNYSNDDLQVVMEDLLTISVSWLDIHLRRVYGKARAFKEGTESEVLQYKKDKEKGLFYWLKKGIGNYIRVFIMLDKRIKETPYRKTFYRIAWNRFGTLIWSIFRNVIL